MTKTEQEIEKIILPTIKAIGYELYDLEFLKESSEWFLRIYIEKDNHVIDLDDCEKVSRAVSDKLDEEDPISQAYNLEVSSCGLERHLRENKHFNWAIGKNIAIKLYKTLNGQKEFEGVLEEYQDEKLVIKLDSKEKIEIEKQDLASAKILYNWEETEK